MAERALKYPILGRGWIARREFHLSGVPIALSSTLGIIQVSPQAKLFFCGSINYVCDIDTD